MIINLNLQPDLDAKDFLALGVKVGDKLKITRRLGILNSSSKEICSSTRISSQTVSSAASFISESSFIYTSQLQNSIHSITDEEKFVKKFSKLLICNNKRFKYLYINCFII